MPRNGEVKLGQMFIVWALGLLFTALVGAFDTEMAHWLTYIFIVLGFGVWIPRPR